MALAFSTEGQESTQPILFSSPDNGNGANLNAINGDSSLSLQNALQSPSLFNRNKSGGNLSLPSGAASSSSSEADGARLQNLLNDRKNWAFMTPEEILGLSTTDNSRQTSSGSGAGQGMNLSAVDRFTERQIQSGNANASSFSSFGWQDPNKENSSKLPSLVSDNLKDSAPNWNLQGATLNDNSFNSKGSISSLSQLFDSSGAAPQPLLSIQQNQNAGMEQFRQLLQPPASAVQPPPSTVLPNWNIGVKTPSGFTFAPDNGNDHSGIGAALTPLRAEIATPSGLTPLLGAVAQQNSTPQSPPSWAPKPPPWLSKEPQPFQIPQRKF